METRRTVAWAAWATLGLALCAQGAWGAEAAAQLDETFFAGLPFQVENLTVWPVYTKNPVQAPGKYITLAEAQEKKTAQVREVGAPSANAATPPTRNDGATPVAGPGQSAEQQASAGHVAQGQSAEPQASAGHVAQGQSAEPQASAGHVAQGQSAEQQASAGHVAQGRGAEQQVSDGLVAQGRDGEVAGQVNRLVIENGGDLPILVLAGTLVRGGKQDRQIAQDFIIPPGKTVPVEAFCVEHGRWTASRSGENTGGNFQGQKVLAPNSVRYKGKMKEDQNEVWQKVAEENAKAGKAPETGTLMACTTEENNKEALARRQRLNKALTGKLATLAANAKKPEDAPVGLGYAVDGKLREIRAFNDPRIFQRYTEVLVNTVAMEAELAQRDALANKRPVYDGLAETKLVGELVEKLKQTKAQTKDAAHNLNYLQKAMECGASELREKDAEGHPAANPVSKSWSAE